MSDKITLPHTNSRIPTALQIRIDKYQLVSLKNDMGFGLLETSNTDHAVFLSTT